MMFPDADGNSFTVPYSDQFLLCSNLLDDYNHNPYPPFCFFDQNFTQPLLSPSDEQQLELQNSPIVQYQGQQQPMLTTFEEFTMADTSSNNSGSLGAYCTTENNGLVIDPANGISSSAVEHMKLAKVSNNNMNLSKKDRHSKINTAQGPRDRRLRLSMDIAKRFFGLQDMLGFDKASKTVDWLLSKSQSEINKVAKNSRTCDGNNIAAKVDSRGACECCEEVSEVVNKDEIAHSEEMDTDKENKKSSSKMKKSGKVPILSVRNGFNNLSKESREKARARAKERTKEKMMLWTLQTHNKQLDENVTDFSNMDQHMLNQIKKPDFFNLGYVDQGHALNQDEPLANISYLNDHSSCIFNNLQQQISEASHQLPFEDFQHYAKPWEQLGSHNTSC